MIYKEGISAQCVFMASVASKAHTDIKGTQQTDTDISIYGHERDPDRQIQRSPYMGISAWEYNIPSRHTNGS